MIGQAALIKHISSLAGRRKLPRVIIFTGPIGQGKKTLANHLIDNCFRWNKYIPEELKVGNTRGIIEHGMALTDNTVYCLFDVDEMKAGAQNSLLKFLEEPPPYAYIIMTTCNLQMILPTIRSRSHIYTLDWYTQEELANFTQDEEILAICSNPGQIQKMLSSGNVKLMKTCTKVVLNIGKISTANAFKILKSFDEEEYELIVPALVSCYTRILPDGLSHLKEIRVLYKYGHQIRNKSINTKNAIEMMFVELREAAMS